MPLDSAPTNSDPLPVVIEPISTGDDPVPDFGKKKKKKIITSRSFADIYELTGVTLGEGAASIVRECRDRKLGVAYAAKFVDKRHESFSRNKVLGEIAILQKCKGQDTILQIVEYFEEETNFILIFEKLDGGPLMNHVKECKAFTERTASLVVKDIATALVFLHDRGIAHRDIKPENILCVFKDRVTPVKLCDFNLGASRELQPNDDILLNAPVGTPEFMSPEVAEAVAGNIRQPYDELCDVWSLGVILHIMLTGTAPFSSDCGQDCGWKRGQACELCSEELLENISRGRIDFGASVWQSISGGAKDLIARMLVRVPQRLTARQVLQHPWICQTPPDTPLPTPARLAVRDVNPFDAFASDANEKLRIADTKAVEASSGIPIPRRVSQSRLATSFSSVIGHDLKDIRTPNFLVSPMLGRSTTQLNARTRSTERFISPLALSNHSPINEEHD